MATLLEFVKAYLGDDHSWSDAQITSAFEAEREAQANVCVVPKDLEDSAEWPAPLVEALGRRVARNLALRNVPLGVQTSISEAAVATTRVGGDDAEVRRLEGPYRPVVFG